MTVNFATLLLGAGGKPSTWFPPGGCRANTATERKRTNKLTKNHQKIRQITRHIAIFLVAWGSVARWLSGFVARWRGGLVAHRLVPL